MRNEEGNEEFHGSEMELKVLCRLMIFKICVYIYTHICLCDMYVGGKCGMYLYMCTYNYTHIHTSKQQQGLEATTSQQQWVYLLPHILLSIIHLPLKENRTAKLGQDGHKMRPRHFVLPKKLGHARKSDGACHKDTGSTWKIPPWPHIEQFVPPK